VVFHSVNTVMEGKEEEEEEEEEKQGK